MSMIQTKQDFIKTFLPDTVEEVSFAQIDMDITDLSLSDIIRNVNRTYPINSRDRNAIASGRLAVGILCKTELIDPLSGIFLIFADEDNDIQIVSKNYIVLVISESRIRTDKDILEIFDKVTSYLVENFKDCIYKFKDFFVKFIYNPDEMLEDEDD